MLKGLKKAITCIGISGLLLSSLTLNCAIKPTKVGETQWTESKRYEERIPQEPLETKVSKYAINVATERKNLDVSVGEKVYKAIIFKDSVDTSADYTGIEIYQGKKPKKGWLKKEIGISAPPFLASLYFLFSYPEPDGGQTKESYDKGLEEFRNTGAGLLLLSGVAAGAIYLFSLQKYTDTKTLTKTDLIDQREEIKNVKYAGLLESHPAVNAPISVSNKYFLFNQDHSASYCTDEKGKVKIPYELPNNFSFSKDLLKDVPLIHSLKQSGIPDSSINSLLKTAIPGVSIPITIKTIFSEENAVNDEKTVEIQVYRLDCSYVDLISDVPCEVEK